MEYFRFFSDEELVLLLDDDDDAEAVEVVDKVGVDGLEVVVVVESSSIALCKGVTVHLLLLSSLMAEAGLELLDVVVWLVMIHPPVVDPVELSL